MDKRKVFRLVRLGIFSFTPWVYTFAEDDTQDEEDDEDEFEDDLEPMNELPDVQPICPNLERALNSSINKYKVDDIKVDDPFFKHLNLAVDISSLGKDLWFLIAQREKKNRSHEYDYHLRLGSVWKYNFYLGGDIGYTSGKDCVWEGDDENAGTNKKLDTKYAHLFKGFYTNAIIGYNYHFNNKNDVIFAGKFGYAWTTITKLKDQTFSEGTEHSFQPYWIGLLVSVETQPFSIPIFFGFDLQLNYLLSKEDLGELKNYYIPDYGHASYKVNFVFNLFFGLKMTFEDEIITP